MFKIVVPRHVGRVPECNACQCSGEHDRRCRRERATAAARTAGAHVVDELQRTRREQRRLRGRRASGRLFRRRCRRRCSHTRRLRTKWCHVGVGEHQPCVRAAPIHADPSQRPISHGTTLRLSERLQHRRVRAGDVQTGRELGPEPMALGRRLQRVAVGPLRRSLIQQHVVAQRPCGRHQAAAAPFAQNLHRGKCVRAGNPSGHEQPRECHQNTPQPVMGQATHLRTASAEGNPSNVHGP